MPKARGLIAALCTAMLAVPVLVAAQGSHDIEFHAVFPGHQSGDALDCSSGEAAYAPLRAGRTLQLADDTGAVMGSAILEDVVPPSREGMCETSVTFVGVSDAPAYIIRAGDQAIATRDKVDLEATGWVARSMYGTLSEPGPTPTPTPSAGPWDIEVFRLGDLDAFTEPGGAASPKDEQDDISVEDIADWLDAMGVLSSAVPATPFTGKLIDRAEDESAGECSTEDGLDYCRGLRLVETYEWSDPRLPEALTSIVNVNSYFKDPYGLLLVFSSAYRLDGPDGSWSGTATVLWDPGDDGSPWDESSPWTTVLTGDGAYEGLVVILRCADTTCDGYVFEDELPPMPEPVEPLAE